MKYIFKIDEKVFIPKFNCDGKIMKRTHGKYRIYVGFKPNDPNKYPGGNIRFLDEIELTKI